MSAHRCVIAAAVVLALISVAAAEPPTPAARTEAVVLRAGVSQSVAMKSGKAIRSARSAEPFVQVSPNEPDVKTVLLRGLRPGVSRLTLIDADGAEESLLVAVEGEVTPAAREVRPNLVKAMQDALKLERDPPQRLMLAEGLMRVAPEDAAAARELVEALTSASDTLPADAYLAIGRLLPDSPPALVAALTPLLRSRDDITRRRAAALLLKLDPKALP